MKEEMSDELKENFISSGYNKEYVEKLIRVIDILQDRNTVIGIYLDEFNKPIVYKY